MRNKPHRRISRLARRPLLRAAAALRPSEGGRPAGGTAGRDLCRARLGRSAHPQPRRGARLRRGRQPPVSARLRGAGAVLHRRRPVRARRSRSKRPARQARPACSGADHRPGFFRRGCARRREVVRLRDSGAAEIVCLVLAIALDLEGSPFARRGNSSWAVQVADGAARLTLAGWWTELVSLPLFYFLLLRGLWRYLIWAWLLSRLASLELRLVATHPDGKAASVSRRISECLFDVRVRHEFGDGDHRCAARVRNEHFVRHLRLHHHRLARDRVRLFVAPLLAFSKPLGELKRRSEELLGAQATRYHRAAERALIGRNVVANDPSEADPERAAADPSAQSASPASCRSS